jgi:hypothetical protein
MKSADKSVPEQLEKLHFFSPFEIEVVSNPRSLKNPGWGEEKMSELREGIQNDGLKQALEVRIVGKKPRLIAGERRLRSIQRLIELDVDCYDRNTNKWGKASKVYAKVKCIVTECADDKEAARAAVLENLLHEHLTDYELLFQCETLEASGHSRTEQAKVFGKSEAWVSQSHSLLKGHPKILEAMTDDTLGRTQALELLKCPPEKVEGVLARSIAYSKMDMSEKEKELVVHQNNLYEKLEEYEANLAAAQELGAKPSEIANINRAIAEGEKAADANERKIQKYRRSSSKRKPRPSMSNIQRAANEADAAGGTQRHVPMKSVRRWADQLTSSLAEESPLVDTDTGEEFSRREVRILRDLMDLILARNGLKSPLEILLIKENESVAAK